jgi:hypothetical protein
LSKKKKIPSRQAPTKPQAKAPEMQPAESSLIHFDRKTWIFLSLLLAAYVFMSAMKMHTSSIGYWNTLFEMPKSKAVIWGTPKQIRMDEWMTATPTLIGQVKAGMPVKNESLGSGNVPVILGFPVKDMSSLLRPSVWSYFFFDLETAFAFSWNFSNFFFLVSMFLLLMLLTRSHFWLSVFGTFFIFFSSGIQWWSYYISIYMMYLNGVILSVVYILHSKKRIPMLFAGIILLFSAYGYLFNLYPPFQVPLVYLYLFIFIGFLLRHKDYANILSKVPLRMGVLSAAVLILGLFVFHYYELTKDTYAIMMNTVYPGMRVVSGGDLADGKFFSEFFGMFMTDRHVPAQWMNISEASGLLVFFPVLFYAIAYNYIKFKRYDSLQIVLSGFLLFATIFILIGIPVFLSKLTLLSMVEARRFLPVAQAGNCILLICFLSDKKTGEGSRFSWIEFAALLVFMIIFFTLVGNHINDSTNNFFKSDQLKTVIVLFTAIYLLIRYSYIQYGSLIACLLIAGVTLPNVSINPLTSGLSPILENPLVVTSQAIHEKDPNATWAVYGASNWADLLKSNGIKTFNGTKITPPLDDFKIIDPPGKNSTYYNRFAHMRLREPQGPSDTLYFEQPTPDGYSMYLDPCSPRLEKLGIKYFLFSKTPQEMSLRCMTPADSLGFYLFKRKD